MYKKKTRRYPQARAGSYRPDFNLYNEMKEEWLRAHPIHTQEERDNAIREIAQRCGI